MPRGLSPNICNQIERNGVIPDECKFLNPTLHFCDSWKGMLLDDSDPEFDRCECGRSTRDAD